jgi:molybdopterin molybdotransferase
LPAQWAVCHRFTAARIFTGAPIPPGADACPQEFCAVDGDHVVIRKEALFEEWVRRAGSDIQVCRCGARR